MTTPKFIPPSLAHKDFARSMPLMSCDRGARFYVMAAPLTGAITLVEYYLCSEIGFFEKLFFRYFDRKDIAVETYEKPDIADMRRILVSSLAEGARLRRSDEDVVLPGRNRGEFRYPYLAEICDLLDICEDNLFCEVFDLCVERKILDPRDGFTKAQVARFMVSMQEEIWSMGIRAGSDERDDTTIERRRQTRLLVDHLKEKRWFAIDEDVEDLRRLVRVLFRDAKPRRCKLDDDDTRAVMRVFELDNMDEIYGLLDQ